MAILRPDLRVTGMETVSVLVSVFLVVELGVDVAGHVAGVYVGVDDCCHLAGLVVWDAVDVLRRRDVTVSRTVDFVLDLHSVVEPGGEVLAGTGGAGGAAGVLTVSHGAAVTLVTG